MEAGSLKIRHKKEAHLDLESKGAAIMKISRREGFMCYAARRLPALGSLPSVALSSAER